MTGLTADRGGASGGRGLLVGMLLLLQVSKAQVAPQLSSAQLDFARSPGCAIYGLTGCTRFRTHHNNIALTSFDPHCRLRTYEDTTNFPVDADFNMGKDFQRGGETGCCALPVYGKDSTIRRNKVSLLMASGRTIASYVPIWKSATSVVRKYAMQWGFNDAYEGAPFIGFVGTSAIKDYTYVWSVVRDPLARFESAFRTTHGDQLRRQMKAFEKTYPQGTAQRMFRDHYRHAHISHTHACSGHMYTTHAHAHVRDHYQAEPAFVCKASAGWPTDADERPPTDANVLSDVDKHARHAHPAVARRAGGGSG